jgi:transcription-repair coupling factor (superfamily II helicase)
VLADQHFSTFSRRFKPFPFKVGLLSRFQTKAEQHATLAQMRTGQVDVVIATHRALSKDVDFSRLGLLVIDEEQRFGVKQKEALKMRWPEVDVLSMSATPIHALHMSLIALRHLADETTPVARKPVNLVSERRPADQRPVRELAARPNYYRTTRSPTSRRQEASG